MYEGHSTKYRNLFLTNDYPCLIIQLVFIAKDEPWAITRYIESGNYFGCKKEYILPSCKEICNLFGASNY
jgi:hypothetical protein